MAVFVLVILLYACLCVVLWIPVPIGFSTGLMTIATWIGLLGYFAGLGLLVWGRYALGRSYGVASSLGASIRPDHELVVSGPYAYLRHPMYLGLLIFTFSGFMVYRTWTFIFLALNFLSLFSRARQEERLMRQA
jgi:protein-S-isoprenylcysteine O-methyltransferase Ste14